MKLLAKNAEDRYQSAFGLKYDLERVLETVETGHALSLQLGTRDFSGRFQIPQKLYGREAEIEVLLNAFERVANPDLAGFENLQGLSELLLVSGYSGVGKSALVYEIHKPITEKQGYFISGKYDQFQRNVPYYALTQALNEFCNHLLTETVASLATWKHKILMAVGNNGQVLIEVLPNLEWVIGEQPAVPEVGPQESQNRFNMVFQNFIKAICQPEHPLVMFIDDLQWADMASLELLKQMLTDADNLHLLIIGAYRDNDVDATHPFMLLMDELKKDGVAIQSLSLPNLTVADVTMLVAETLQNEPDSVSELVHLLYEKTQGNAFFVTQFLITLYEQGHITFDYAGYGWRWDVSEIRGLNISDNVVELMASKLARLDEATQAMLKLAACIGNKFALSTLAVISEQTPHDALTAIWSAVAEGLVMATDENYRQLLALGREADNSLDSHFKFLHDRIQQAAYSSIAENDRAKLHLKIGRLWLADTAEAKLEERLFDIINQLNAGRTLISAEGEKLQLAELNLQASHKAKSAIAYQTALSYVTIALSLLPAESWSSHYELAFNLMITQAECQFLIGQLAEAEASFKLALEHAQTNLEKGNIFSALVQLYTHQLDFERWAEASSQGLHALGLEIPMEGEAVSVAIGQALGQIQAYLADKEIESLLDLPELTDETKLKALNLCIQMIPISYLTGNLYTLLGLKMVTLSLEFGNSIFASFAYVIYGSILVMGSGDYRRGYEWGRLGLQLAEKYPPNTMQVRSYFLFALVISPWQQPIKSSVAYFLQGYTQGIEVGNLVYAGHSGHGYIIPLFFMGVNLGFIEQETVKYFAFAEKTKNQFAINSFFAHISLILALTGQLSWQDTSLTEEVLSQKVRISGDKLALIRYLINRLKADYLLGHYEAALEAAQEDVSLVELMVGTLFFAEFYFYHALTLVALWPTLAEGEQGAALETITACQALIKNWRENCLANFEAMDLILSAEVARLHENGMETMVKLYDQAIASAKEYEFLHLQALANELAAKFWLKQNNSRFADLYLREAHYAYQQWGATVKVEQLEAQYPELRVQGQTVGNIHATSHHSNSYTGSQMLDLASVMKASQTISGEIKLASLLEKMMQIVVENAGAQLGLLILRQGDKWLIQAEVETRHALSLQVEVLQAIPIESIGGQSHNPKLSGAMLRYVERSQKALVLNDARQEAQFAQTDYVQKRQPKSILCVPMINQGVVMGIIYLENNLSTHAFTPERVEVVQLLGTQATISLHNVQTITLQAEQERLRIENEMLGKLNADKDKFFSIVAHDLKGPFLPLLGNLELLMEMADTLSPKEVQEMSAASHRSARRVFDLLENLLHWARLQMGRMEYQPEPITLYEVAQQTVHVLSEVAESKGISLVNEVIPEVVVYGDGNMLNTIIRNLVNNALKFTSQGGQVVIRNEELGIKNEEIHNSQFVIPNYVVVSIVDTGVGMSEEVRQKLFKLDQHVTTQGTAKETGTGLGLIICQEMVEKHGGRIWVESELGKGTTVKFTVRLAE